MRTRSIIQGLVAVLMLLSVVSGCRLYEESLVHDELFTYEKPFDETYLIVLQAINKSSDWNLYSTDKEKGIIVAQPENYIRSSETVTILISRVERGKTSVELAPASQRIAGVESLLKSIDQEFLS